MSNELNVKNGIQERRDVMAKMVGTLAYAGGLTVVDGEKNLEFPDNCINFDNIFTREK